MATLMTEHTGPTPKSSILFTWNRQNVAPFIQNPEIERDFDARQSFVTKEVLDGKTSLQRCE